MANEMQADLYEKIRKKKFAQVGDEFAYFIQRANAATYQKSFKYSEKRDVYSTNYYHDSTRNQIIMNQSINFQEYYNHSSTNSQYNQKYSSKVCLKLDCIFVKIRKIYFKSKNVKILYRLMQMFENRDNNFFSFKEYVQSTFNTDFTEEKIDKNDFHASQEADRKSENSQRYCSLKKLKATNLSIESSITLKGLKGANVRIETRISCDEVTQVQKETSLKIEKIPYSNRPDDFENFSSKQLHVAKIGESGTKLKLHQPVKIWSRMLTLLSAVNVTQSVENYEIKSADSNQVMKYASRTILRKSKCDFVFYKYESICEVSYFWLEEVNC